MNDHCWDVVVVGSGLSGLTTTYRLLQANSALRVLMVDALPSFGGRTKSIDLPQYNAKVSVGGTFALFEHHDTLALAAELQCTPDDPLPVSAANLALFSPDLLGVISTSMGLPLFLELMWKGAKVISGGKIQWDSSTARKLDSMSLETWINNQSLLKYLNPNFTREFFYLLETYPDLATVSALQCAIALYVRFMGIPRNGFEIPPQTLRWEGGTGVFTSAMVDYLSTFGPDHFQLLLNSPVKSITQPVEVGSVNNSSDDYPVRVTIGQQGSNTPLQVRANYVVVAASPLASAPKNLGGMIDYTPPLPTDAATLFSSCVATPTASINILVIYKRPWWRQYGGVMILPAYATHIHEKGVWGNVVDGSMSGEDVTGIVRIFCDSRRVANWSQDAIKSSAIDFLKKLFPTHEQAQHIDSFLEILIWDWNTCQPSLPGVTYTFPPSGVLSSNGPALTRPHGRIHWAGSERSVWGCGWMEGAVERGNDVAQDLIRLAGWARPGYDVRGRTTRSGVIHGLGRSVVDEEEEVEEVESSDDEYDGEWTMVKKENEEKKTTKKKSMKAQLIESRTQPSGAPRTFIARTRLDLAAHLFTQPHQDLTHSDKMAQLAQVQPPIGASPKTWVSPHACMAALKELQDAKDRRSGAASAAEGLFCCSMPSSDPTDARNSGCVLC